MKNTFKFLHGWVGAVLLTAVPVAVFAQGADYDALIAQIPTPPTTLAAGNSRWHEGLTVGMIQDYYDKSGDAVLVKLESLEKSLAVNHSTYGGESGADIQKKIAGMSEQEKMAYGMQLAQKAMAGQQAAYANIGQAKALMRSHDTDMQMAQKGMALEKANRNMQVMEQTYKAKFDALDEKLHVSTQACPEVKAGGDMLIRAPACIKPLLVRYKTDYMALANQQLTAYNTAFAQFKAAAATDIGSWKRDIASLQGNDSEAARNEITRKQSMIYMEIGMLSAPASQAVKLGYEALQMDPARVCGGDCD